MVASPRLRSSPSDPRGSPHHQRCHRGAHRRRRRGARSPHIQTSSDWAPEDLPEPRARQVSWGVAIGDVVSDAVLLVLLLLPGRIGGRVEALGWGQIFTDAVYSVRWVLGAGVAVSPVTSIYVLAQGHRTWPTALVNLLGALLFTVPVLWLAACTDLIAWDTLPFTGIGDGDLRVNETLTLSGIVALVLAIFLWETVDSPRQAAASGPRQTAPRSEAYPVDREAVADRLEFR